MIVRFYGSDSATLLTVAFAENTKDLTVKVEEGNEKYEKVLYILLPSHILALAIITMSGHATGEEV